MQDISTLLKQDITILRLQVAPNYQYYCQDPEGYYPDVDECPDGWQQVAPQPDED